MDNRSEYFELTCDQICYKVPDCTWDSMDPSLIGNYAMEPGNPPSWMNSLEAGLKVTGSVWDGRYIVDGSALNPYCRKVAAQFYDFNNTMGEYGGNVYYGGPGNVRVSRVQGKLSVLP